MNYVLILFFASLLGLGILVGRRVLMLRNGNLVLHNSSPLVPPAHEVRYVIIKNLKKGSLIIIAVVIRLSIRSSMYARKAGSVMAQKIRARMTKHGAKNPETKKEVSGFLRSVSEYKKKVSELKDRIKEEEKEY